MVCGGQANAHHLQEAQASAMSSKSGDQWSIPLCPSHHQALHAFGDESVWWSLAGIDPNRLGEEQLGALPDDEE